MDTPSSNAPSAPATSSSPSTASSPAPSATSASAGTVSAKSAPGPDTYENNKSPVAETKTEEARKARKLKLKVDGKEEEYDVDAMSDEQLAIDIQMAKAARKRMQESADTKKQFNSIIEGLKKGDFSILKDPAIGIDVRKMVEDQLVEEFKANQLPEHERKAMELEKKLQEREAKLKEYETKESEAARQKLEASTLQEIETDFKTALESKDLPKTRETMALMAEVAATYLEKHGIQLTPQQLASEVESRIQSQAKYVLSKMNPAALVKYLGQDVVNSLVKHSVDTYKAKQAAGSAGRQTAPGETTEAFTPRPPEKPKHSSISEGIIERSGKKTHSMKDLVAIARGRLK